MYEEFFGIEENPFSITPDPRYLYMSKGHQEALAHLLYGISENGGFVMLTGEVGTGKTSVCRCLLEQLPNASDVALILNPKLNELEFVASICDELGFEYPKETTSLKVLVDVLNKHLLELHAQGRHGIVIIDEAQNLSTDVLEQVRLLTNLETAKKKLLQMILIGQPELNDLIARHEMRQLAQRVTARYHLDPLSRADVQAYIDHRLSIGGLPSSLFTNWAREAIYRRSGGIPRLINALCDRCLMAAYVKNSWTVDGGTVRDAAREVFGRRPRLVLAPRRRWLPWATAAAAAAIVVLAALIPFAFSGGLSLQEYRAHVNRMVANVLTWSAEDESGGSQAAIEEAPKEQQPVFSTLRVLPENGDATASQSPAAKGSSLAETQNAALPQQPPRQLEDDQTPRILERSSVLADLSSGSSVSLYEVFDPLRFENDADTAMTGLFNLWNLDYAAMDRSRSCAEWNHEGIRCLRGRDSWQVVMSLDRPAIITLRDSEGNRAHGLLIGTEGDRVALQFGLLKIETDRAALEPLWSGQYLMLWRAPSVFQRTLSLGRQGKDVTWLHDRLAELDGIASSEAGRATFDAELRSRVVAFQRSRGLKADGIVGPQTIIHLDNSASTKSRGSNAPGSSS